MKEAELFTRCGENSCEEARGCGRWADGGLLVTWDDGDIQARAAAYGHI